MAGVFALLTACTATRSVRPVGEGKVAVGASLGGPVFTNLAAPIPTPVLSTFGRYGLTSRADLDFGLNLTPAAAQGLDLGAAYLLREQSGLIPAVMAGGRAYLYVNALAFTSRLDPNTGRGYTLSPRIFEQIYANASWKLGQSFLIWAGLDLFAQVENAVFLPSIVAGGEWRAGRRVGLVAELKQMAILSDQEFSTISYLGPGHRGALALQLGVNVYLGDVP